jgi:hypothetical protein
MSYIHSAPFPFNQVNLNLSSEEIQLVDGLQQYFKPNLTPFQANEVLEEVGSALCGMGPPRAMKLEEKELLIREVKQEMFKAFAKFALGGKWPQEQFDLLDQHCYLPNVLYRLFRLALLTHKY